ncbi:MAG TPA: 4Fe-4S dicluster domain-containing protein [Anaerolineales bacterium]
METIGTMFSDVSGSLFRRPVTESYPFERTEAPAHLRGLLQLELASCTGCGLCAMDCPANALHVSMLDRKARRFVMEYHIDRCAFCGQCTESCRQGALSMSSEQWELAQLDKSSFTVHFGDPRDVEQLLAGMPQGAASEADRG